ncbi:uncharacterized protein LOC143448654 [Clavelina lepadiformis]|uniref:uncharacterized protein LOC143448654 n=1 Tax=Clavelina lepadiformis TaxID=159417 RepID=UPI0040430122
MDNGISNVFAEWKRKLNEYLVVITGKTLADLSSKDPLSNKFNLTLFIILIVFVSSMTLLCCIGLTHGCCISSAEKRKRKAEAKSKRAQSITYRRYSDNTPTYFASNPHQQVQVQPRNSNVFETSFAQQPPPLRNMLE